MVYHYLLVYHMFLCNVVLYLADELSPDNMRLWKKDTRERFDKDLFRKDEGDIVEAYKYILTKLRQFA